MNLHTLFDFVDEHSIAELIAAVDDDEGQSVVLELAARGNLIGKIL